MKKISLDLLQRIANVLISSTGHTFIEVNNLINEMNKLEDIEKPTDATPSTHDIEDRLDKSK